jgi:DNA-binding IclR family transcriptional regulator
MRKNDTGAPATPTIQVIERMFALIDVLASREEAVSLKEISRRPGAPSTTTHPERPGPAAVDRPEAGSYRLGMRLLGWAT